MKTITFTNNNAADVVAANLIKEYILQNGQLAHLRNKKMRIIKIGNVREIVPSLKPVVCPFEPRFEFNGEYDIIVGRFFKIKTKIEGVLNRYEIIYGYTASPLFSRELDILGCLNFFMDYIKICYDNYYEVEHSLDFEEFRTFFVGLIMNDRYIDDFFKIDQENKIIYYKFPKVFTDHGYKSIIKRGSEIVEKAKEAAKEAAKLLGNKDESELVSNCLYSLLLSQCPIFEEDSSVVKIL